MNIKHEIKYFNLHNNFNGDAKEKNENILVELQDKSVELSENLVRYSPTFSAKTV